MANTEEPAPRNIFNDPVRFNDRMLLERRISDPMPSTAYDGRLWYDTVTQTVKFSTPVAIRTLASSVSSDNPLAVYAKDFGFDVGADGATNSTALNSALSSAASSDSLKIVVMEAGIFNLSATITSFPNVHLIGQGRGSTVLKWDGVTGAVIMNAPPDKGSYSRFTIDGNNLVGVIGLDASAGNLPNLASWRELTIIDCLGTGFRLNPSAGDILGNDFANFVISNCGIGIDISPPSGKVNGNRFGYLEINDCGTAIKFDNTAGAGVNGNTIEFLHAVNNTTYAVDAVDLESLIIQGCYFETNGANWNVVSAEQLIMTGWADSAPFTYPDLPASSAPVVLTPGTDILSVVFADIGFDTYRIKVELTGFLSSWTPTAKTSTGFTLLFANTIPAAATALWSVERYS